MTHITKTLEFPKELEKIFSTAKRYEWLSLFYMLSAAIFSFLTMSNSQTMKTVWLEDSLGIIPPLTFLIASKVVRWKANNKFPYGYHKVTGIAYLTSSVALFILGLYLFFDGLTVLIKMQHPTIPNFYLGGYSIWLGYLMILALLWSSIPSSILGHIKIPLAKKLYDKILYADSKMNKASWMSGIASILGIIGIGFGFWWADAVFAILISFNIIQDGFKNTKQSILDLMDETPRSVDGKHTEPLITKIKSALEEESWIKSFHFRFRDEGHVFFGDIYIEPKAKEVSVDKIKKLEKKIEDFHWRFHDIMIMPIVLSNHNGG